MNDLQKVLFNIIVNIVNTPGVFDYRNDIDKPIRNFISRYSLANDSYYVSESAYELFDQFNLTLPLRRSKLRKLKEHFTYEHPVPSCVVLGLIKQSNQKPEEVEQFLKIADCVTLVTKKEDRVLNAHRDNMPEEWNYVTCSQFARYDFHELNIRKEKISVIGALQL